MNVAKRVNNFSYTSMIAAQECGFEFHIAGNWSYRTQNELIADEKKYGIRVHQIDFVRRPYNLKNRKAYKQLLSLCRFEKFDIIHCNTPVGGLLGRLVGEKCKVKTVIYQAHGFHFYKGSSLVSWLIYYPIEKWLAHKTDILITINKEDYALAARRMHLRKDGIIEYVPGVGIDLDNSNCLISQSDSKRIELGISKESFVIISTGDLIKRKNYKNAIKAVSLLNYDVSYIICGLGPEEKRLKKLTHKLGISDKVFFLGYRTDVLELLCMSDVFLLTSYQEGLSRSLMEAMSKGLPCVASRIRGNTDLLGENNEYLINPDDYSGFAKALHSLLTDPKKRKENINACLKNIIAFSNDVAVESYKKVYERLKI